jgi:flagellar biosynthetic protein FliR
MTITFALDLSRLAAFLLLFCRVGGVLVAAPLVGSQRVPARLRAALALAISVVLAPTAGSAPPCEDTTTLALAIGRELLIGLAIGFGANLIFAAIQMAGELADLQSAFGFAGMVSPQTGERSSVIGQLQMSIAWLIFLAADGHQVLLQGLGASLVTAPLGSGPGFAGPALTAAVAGLLVTSVRIAAPIVAATMLADLALGLLTRAAPQMNLLAIGFPIKLVVGVGATLLSLPILVSAQRGLISSMETIMRGVLAAAR